MTSAAEKLAVKVRRLGPDDCWEWQAGRDADGYGQIWIGGRNGRNRKAHIVAWEEENGIIPAGLCVLHRCDNPSCCNPSHLFLGTKGQNNSDRAAKGRSAFADRNGKYTKPERTPRGERHGCAKLTELQVIGIMALWLQGESLTQIGREFGVDRRQVGRIVAGKGWSHVFPSGADGE